MSTNEDIVLELEKRTALGKGLNELRKNGKLPAVIHDHGRESIHVAGDYSKIAKAYTTAGKHHPVQLQIGKDLHLALIKDVDSCFHKNWEFFTTNVYQR